MRQVQRWWMLIAGVAVAALAIAILLPGLDGFGLWEPQERQLADRDAPRDGYQPKNHPEAFRPAPKPPEPKQSSRAAGVPGTAGVPGAVTPPPVVTPPVTPIASGKETCDHQAPKDAEARSLTARAAVWGRDNIGDSDGGRRLPFALLGIMTALLIGLIAARGAGPRAGVLAGLIALSMPLLVLQSRQLTSEIGTTAGAVAIVWGLYTLATIGPWRRGVRFNVLLFLHVDIAIVAIALGSWLAFYGGGLLVGVIPPFVAFALAGSLGAPLFVLAGQGLWNASLRGLTTVAPRIVVGRRRATLRATDLALALAALAAAIIATYAIYSLLHQVFELRTPQPGTTPLQREIFGKAIVPTGWPSTCWSSMLGGTWRADDDLRYIYDSTFEQIAYGTFPWGVLAPIAFAQLIASQEPRKRLLGSVTLAWAAAAWVANEVFQRKVGFALYTGFPAIAIAVGVWVDGLLAARHRGDVDRTGPPVGDQPPGAKLIGLFFFLAVLDLAKDQQSFTDKVTSLLVGGESIPYPTSTHVLFLPTKLWILILGMVIAIGFALALITWRPRGKWLQRGPVIATLGGTLALALFWSNVWQPLLSRHLSSKEMFDQVVDLYKPGDALVLMGDLGDAPHDYAPDIKPEVVQTREQITAALGREQRVFAIAPQGELCTLHHDMTSKPYFVLDAHNQRSYLLSNRVDGGVDENPLRDVILHTEPKKIPNRPKARIVFDNRIELLGWKIDREISRSSTFEVTTYYKVLSNIGGSWQALYHFDMPKGPRGFNGDHKPIDDRCSMASWQKGDYIVDRFTVTAGSTATLKGQYDVWTGFFTGSFPNWRNMPISEAPGDMRDNTDRVKITQITID